MQITSTHCDTLQPTVTHTTAHCNTPQPIIHHCNKLQHTANSCKSLQRTAAHCNALQHTATRCNTKTHCKALQHTALTQEIFLLLFYSNLFVLFLWIIQLNWCIGTGDWNTMMLQRPRTRSAAARQAINAHELDPVTNEIAYFRLF